MDFEVRTTFYGATDTEGEYIKVTHKGEDKTINVPFHYGKPDPHGHAVNQAVAEWHEGKKFKAARVSQSQSGRGYNYNVDVEI